MSSGESPLALPRHVALLRGINVGKAKRIAMADLAELFRELGYEDVRTLLNSGNVVFSVPRGKAKANHAQRVEQALASRLGVAAWTITLSAAELATIVEENPLVAPASDPSRLLVAVWRTKQDRRLLLGLAERDWKPDRFALGKRAAYVSCPGGILKSELASTLLGRTFKDALTTRNWATLSKLHALARPT